jgi:hypothetical protein
MPVSDILTAVISAIIIIITYKELGTEKSAAGKEKGVTKPMLSAPHNPA